MCFFASSAPLRPLRLMCCLWKGASFCRCPVLSFAHLFTAVQDRGPSGYAACGWGGVGMFGGMPLTRPTSVLEVVCFEVGDGVGFDMEAIQDTHPLSLNSSTSARCIYVENGVQHVSDFTQNYGFEPRNLSYIYSTCLD
jgi:hypothetical protein